MKLKDVRKKMNNNYDIAQELFLKCKNAGCNDILSPINWLYNQNKMLESYDVFKKSYSNNDLMVNIQKMNLLIIWILCVKIIQLDSGID